MIEANPRVTTLPLSSSAPRPPTSQERGDELLRRWRLARAAGPAAYRLAQEPRDLLPEEVISDLLGSEDFPGEVLDTDRAARVILERLRDAGFAVVPAEDMA